MNHKSVTRSWNEQPQTGLTTHRSLLHFALFAGLALAVVGCRSEPTAESPRSVAKSFISAMVTGDEQTLRSVSIGDEPSALLLAAQARQNQAYEHLLKTAAARFKDPHSVVTGRRADDHYSSRLQTIDGERETINGDSATIGEGPNTIYLQRIGGMWKVDRARLVPPGMQDIREHLRMIDALRDADEQIAVNIEKGKYDTADQARAAFIELTIQAVNPSTLPATRPATQPANDPATRPS
jgi:hypothetical protein